MAENLKERDLKVGALRSSIKGHGLDLENARELLAWVIEHDAWRERVDMLNDKPIKFRTFTEFLSTKPPSGLGAVEDDLWRIARGTAVEARLRAVLTGTGLRQGTSRAYVLDRLTREHPELAERVNAGEMSANAAAIEAGFRKPTRSVPVDSPEAAITSLLKIFDRDQLHRALGDG